VAILPGPDGVDTLANESTARDFVNDAFAHAKFIAYSAPAMTLFEKAGVKPDMDAGFMELKGAKDAQAFVTACRKLRFWEREPMVHAAWA